MTTKQQSSPADTQARHGLGGQDILRNLQDEMVAKAEALVKSLNLPKGQGMTKGRTQASKALEVAQTAKSLSVFVNWIRYQAARERSTDFWSRKAGEHSSLAQGVTLELGQLRHTIEEQLPDSTTATEAADVVMQAATRFLGYFRRALIGADYLDDIILPASASKEA